MLRSKYDETDLEVNPELVHIKSATSTSACSIGHLSITVTKNTTIHFTRLTIRFSELCAPSSPPRCRTVSKISELSM
ncbi:hypothetical protein EVAR_40219_1 [Eumeta japonica]|uniref:Uncharacterized protein n=1 Tax=Eumeta variegata TaxID=151549 RepID=A0A4C1XCF9_EUMVA|nr:hypothetical protein EVAR_40219_1 [Eumeta japonica]